MASQLQELLSRYVGQLVNGCGSPDCREPLCDTGKRHDSDRPVRKWTDRSARAIALATVSGPTPRKHLCSHYRVPAAEEPSDESHQTVAPNEEKRDPSSFQQLFSDTSTIRRICTPRASGIEVNPTGLEHHAQAVKSLLTPFSSLRGEISSNKTAARILDAALQACVAQAPSGPSQQYAFANRLVGMGSAYPSDNQRTPAHDTWQVWLRILDYIDIEKPSSRLLVQILQVVAYRAQLDDQIRDLKERTQSYHPELRSPGLNSFSHTLPSSYHDRTMIRQLVALFADMSETSLFCLVLWLKKLFFSHWDGMPLIKRNSITFGSLFLIDAIERYTFTIPRAASNPFLLPGIFNRVSSLEMAESWTELANQCGTEDPAQMPCYNGSHHAGRQSSGLPDELVLSFDSIFCHLLRFDFLSTSAQRALSFRSLNWQRMLKACSMSEKATSNRTRADSFRIRNQEPEGRLRHDEEQFLVLKIRREHVLQDAYDQLWQRRDKELSRPLRVWMAEAENLELGQDLGGVQIEFFNLVCREAFAENAGMFTTNETTGRVYFRPGSIQPLYQFELLGLLIGFAVYNGITLPISMHKTFYRVLLLRHHVTSMGIGDSSFTKDWPVEARSLKYMLEQADQDIENTFPLEANGLRISATYGGKTQMSNGSMHTMNVHHAVRINGSSAGVDVSELSWPGWKLKQVPEDPPPVTGCTEFAEDYKLWMAYNSVAPQLEAFTKGFHRIVDPHTLSIFTTSELRRYIEGTTKLDIHELRRATRYEGYHANEPYVQAFWRVISTWSEEEQMGLLKFVTAAERIPMGGEKELTFVIQHTPGDDDDRLPTSSTCFGTLNLPVYSSADILNTKLTMAVKYGMEGFGVA